MESSLNIELNDVDRRIWAEELDDFVPESVFDIHSHMYRWEFNTDPEKNGGAFYPLFGRQYPLSDWATLNAVDGLLMPGRRMQRLSFPVPFSPSCDFEASNRFIAGEIPPDSPSAALMLVHPSMDAEYIDQQIQERGFLGFKPYRSYSVTGDQDDCGITDFLPEHQIEVANRYGLLVTMHMAKRDGISDPQNVADLTRFAEEYPNVKWILAHAARTYSPWSIERVADQIRDLPNLWYGTSSVCESDAFDALIRSVGPQRVMYGSDDLPVGASRGKFVVFGYAWSCLREGNHSLSLSHCNPQMTFLRYEQLRAMRRATMRHGFSREQSEDLFYNIAAGLVESVRNSIRQCIA